MACEACVTISPVAAEYNPIGSTEKQGDLSGRSLSNLPSFDLRYRHVSATSKQGHALCRSMRLSASGVV
eukprot:28137-Eustigmatos_ZCMA.PRE.1